VRAKLDNGDVKARTVEMKFMRGTTKCTWLNLKRKKLIEFKKTRKIRNKRTRGSKKLAESKEIGWPKY
jgi:hypothetical protein